MSRCNLQLNQHLRQTLEHQCSLIDEEIRAWGLAAPALRALISLNIYTVNDLIQYKKSEIITAHGMGDVAVKRIEEGLAALGVNWTE
jgi:hypothetical protein